MTLAWAIAVEMLPVWIDMPPEPDRCDYLGARDAYSDAIEAWQAAVCDCKRIDDEVALRDLLADPVQPAGRTGAVVADDARSDVYAAANAEMMRRAAEARLMGSEDSDG